MNTSKFHALILSLTVAAGTLLTGCGGGASDKVNVPAQITVLKGEDKEARINALAELAKAGEEAAPAISTLTPLLKDQDPLVRRLAAYALGQIGPKAKSAVTDLKPLLNDGDRDVITSALNALRAIDPTSVGGIKVENTAN